MGVHLKKHIKCDSVLYRYENAEKRTAVTRIHVYRSKETASRKTVYVRRRKDGFIRFMKSAIKHEKNGIKTESKIILQKRFG